MTPRQLRIIAEVERKKQEEEAKEKLTLAYLNSLWTIQWLGKKQHHPKPLEKILKGLEPKKTMTDKDMLAVVKNLNAMFGGEVK